MGKICENVKKLLEELEGKAILLLASKERSVEEIREAIECGAKVFGENYLQEAEPKIREIGHIVEWHYIGSIQKRKIKKIVELFDVIESVDSFEVALLIEKEGARFGKTIPILLEVNSGKEPQKSGVMPEDTLELAKKIYPLKFAKLVGLMTMGPNLENPLDLKPYFELTKELFDLIKKENLFKTDFPILSMGMSQSYKVAVEVGANLVRIGTLVFGERKKKG